MKKSLLALSLFLGGQVLTGCGAPSTELTAEEQKNFKGGPRPANTNEMMQKSIEEFRKKHPTPGNSTQTQLPTNGQ